MLYVGIDWSIRSPASCAISSNVSGLCQFWCLPQTLKQAKQGYLTITRGDKYHVLFDSIPPRTEQLVAHSAECAQHLIDWINASNLIDEPVTVVIEDYAFAATGRVFHIGEHGGVLKHMLYSHCPTWAVHVVPPTVNKKFATGKGNAQKDVMCAAFATQTGVDLHKEMHGSGQLRSPVTDCVDAYFLAKYGLTKNL
jgi:hypothetical protein